MRMLHIDGTAACGKPGCPAAIGRGSWQAFCGAQYGVNYMKIQGDATFTVQP
jgi:hypothetical protein